MIIRLSTYHTFKVVKKRILSPNEGYHRTWRVLWILFVPIFAWNTSETYGTI